MRFKFFDVVSFHMSEQTHFDALVKTYSKLKKLDVNDDVALLSKSKTQLIWVHGYTTLDDASRILTSTRLRLAKGAWSVLLLKAYAEKVGLQVDDWSALDKAMDRGIERSDVRGLVKNSLKSIRSNVMYELLTSRKRRTT